MKNKGDIGLTIVIIVLVLLAIGGYFAYKYFIPQINSVIPTAEPAPSIQPATDLPVVISPKANSKVTSPLTVTGVVPPGWMFEGVFPIKLVDSNKNLIIQGQAKEEVPGSWQSNVEVNFTATLSFTTSAKSGFLIFSNDNPSGDPSKAKTFEMPVTF